MTLAACPPELRSDQFVAFLGSATRYASDGDNLLIELLADGGTMTFTRPAQPNRLRLLLRPIVRPSSAIYPTQASCPSKPSR